MSTRLRREARAIAIDRAGAVCSAACAAHCASFSLFPSALAALGLSALVGPAAEWGFTVGAVLFATTALIMGWLRHRAPLAAVLLAVGIAALVIARMLEETEAQGVATLLAVLAGMALFAGHILGIRIARQRDFGQT